MALKLDTVDAEHLASWLAQRLPLISGLHLSPQNPRVTRVLNWGGFVNHSFSVNDGSAQYHLKITSDLHNIKGVQRWHTLHYVLEKRYRAPKLIQWIDFSERLSQKEAAKGLSVDPGTLARSERGKGSLREVFWDP